MSSAYRSSVEYVEMMVLSAQGRLAATWSPLNPPQLLPYIPDKNKINCEKAAHRSSQAYHWCSFHIFTFFCDLLLCRPTATWNLFVSYDQRRNVVCRKICTKCAGTKRVILEPDRFRHLNGWTIVTILAGAQGVALNNGIYQHLQYTMVAVKSSQ